MDKKLKAMILFGPPGSGKGTLGKVLACAGGHLHLSSGDIFRGLDPSSQEGQLFYRYASQGNLVPDEVTIEVWHHYVGGLIAANRYFPDKQLLLLDGLPRTLDQARILDHYIDLVQIIVLEINDPEELCRRLMHRARVENRADDQNREVLNTRMQVYAEKTLELLTHYPPDKISRFNALQRPIEVVRDVLTNLTSLL